MNTDMTTNLEPYIQLLRQQDATLIAHYYVDGTLQALAEESGGFVGDSLAMARFGRSQRQSTLLVCGVRFMGETAHILSPEKTVLMPTLDATCSLDEGCPIDEFSAFCDAHPDRTVVVYANTSAAVKARADWVVTSSNALEIISYLHRQGEKILWAPDRYLGDYIQKQIGADLLLWDSACIVHEEFKARELSLMKQAHPDADILVHPESPAAVIEQADVVGSTSVLLKATTERPAHKFIVATDRGIFYQMQKASPHKTFLEAPTAGHGATCRSCAQCPWMAMNSLELVEQALHTGSPEIIIDRDIAEQAARSLNQMLHFKSR